MQRSCDGACGVVGIDIVGVARKIGTHGSDHRHKIVGHQSVEQGSVHLHHLAYKPQVLAIGQQLAGYKRVSILSVDSDRVDTLCLQALHQFFGDIARKHHLGDLGRLGIGHPETIDKLGFLTQTVQHLRDGVATSMDHHRFHPNAFHHRDILYDGHLDLIIHHSAAAVFNHYDASSEPTYIGQRLDEDARFLNLPFHSQLL